MTPALRSGSGRPTASTQRERMPTRLDPHHAWEPLAPPVAGAQSVQVLLNLDNGPKRSARIKRGLCGIDGFGAHGTS